MSIRFEYRTLDGRVSKSAQGSIVHHLDDLGRDGWDWAERLFASQADTHAALASARAAGIGEARDG